MMVLSNIGHFRAQGQSRLNDAGNRAIATFAVARTLNGIISVIQELQVGASLGISKTPQPGQNLDPLNDPAERFSIAALIAATLLWSMNLMGNFVVLPRTPLLFLVFLVIRVSLNRFAACADVNQLLMPVARVSIVLAVFVFEARVVLLGIFWVSTKILLNPALNDWSVSLARSGQDDETHLCNAAHKRATPGDHVLTCLCVQPWFSSRAPN